MSSVAPRGSAATWSRCTVRRGRSRRPSGRSAPRPGARVDPIETASATVASTAIDRPAPRDRRAGARDGDPRDRPDRHGLAVLDVVHEPEREPCRRDGQHAAEDGPGRRRAAPSPATRASAHATRLRDEDDEGRDRQHGGRPGPVGARSRPSPWYQAAAAPSMPAGANRRSPLARVHDAEARPAPRGSPARPGSSGATSRAPRRSPPAARCGPGRRAARARPPAGR